MNDSSNQQVTIITASSNSGFYCIEEMYNKFPNKLRIKAAFRSLEKSKILVEKYPNLDIVTGIDAYKTETLTEAFRGSQSALIVTPHDYSRGMNDDAFLTMNMINAAVDCGVKYIVLVASFTTLYMDKAPLIGSRFKPSEELLEKLGHDTGIKWTVLRGGAFMENLLHNVPKIKSDLIFSYPKLELPFVYTKDIGRVAAVCLTSSNIDLHDRKYYSINGPQILSSQEIADHFSKALGKNVKFKELPKDMIKNLMPKPVSELFEHFVDAGREAAPFTDDVSRLTRENGTFEQFLKDHSIY